MKIYINTSTEPPTLSSALSVRTAADGALQVFNASGGGAVSHLRFKRGTTVPLTVLFPLEEIPADGADAKGVPSEMTFAVKLSGKYDDVLVLRASSTEATTPSTGEDAGFARFEMKAEIASSLIDAELRVDKRGRNFHVHRKNKRAVVFGFRVFAFGERRQRAVVLSRGLQPEADRRRRREALRRGKGKLDRDQRPALEAQA